MSSSSGSAAAPAPAREAAPVLPDLRDPRFALERETLKLVVQVPHLVAPLAADLDGNDFTHPAYLAVWDVVAALGGPASAPDPDGWVARLRDEVVQRHGETQPLVVAAFNAVAVEPVRSAGEPDGVYAAASVYRLQELTAMRRIADLKSRLQRTNPVDQATDYNRMFGELVALESHRRTLREMAIGAGG